MASKFSSTTSCWNGEPQYGPPGPYYPGKSGRSGYPFRSAGTSTRHVATASAQTTFPALQVATGKFQQQAPSYKIAVMMEPLLPMFRGRCLVSNILTASGKRFDSLPQLDTYPTGVCWLHAIVTCPYSSQCLLVVGHMKKRQPQ